MVSILFLSASRFGELVGCPIVGFFCFCLVFGVLLNKRLALVGYVLKLSTSPTMGYHELKPDYSAELDLTPAALAPVPAATTP